MRFVVFILSVLAAPLARAEGLAIETSTHVGYGMVSRSEQGFDGVGGSLVFLDLSLPLGERVAAGLRTLAQGGRKGAAEFYRLGSGPFVSWEAFDSLYLQLTANAY